MYRRARALADYENCDKALDRARLRGKDIPQAEENQRKSLQKFNRLSESGKKGEFAIQTGFDELFLIFKCVVYEEWLNLI